MFRERIVSSGITKYNVGNAHWKKPLVHKKVILVAGQVESDASITFGSPVLRTNLELLKAARQANQDAWIVYKPHPDVVAGLRAKGVTENELITYCDAPFQPRSATVVIN